ncbi:hypothetical protein SERLADRAFT_441913 [Serpula lacrymans var. lacrymans S7.9]|nr:uncharacterized protein SERLADRAFT_441913 [Serpula lacrymans var. lacrymans S7.9]EGO20574.1 hypothetical protein SERLADRAFT_441913 [Serpula lacrymans var. lacrymans S7.9]
MRMDNLYTWFLALSIQGGLGNKNAVDLLEHNVNPHIAEQLYLQDMRSQELSQVAEEVHKIGRAMELYKCNLVACPPPKATMVTPKTIVIFGLNAVCEAHHQEAWKFCLALVESTNILGLGYKMVPGSCGLA